jgi:hypothetical protein
MGLSGVVNAGNMADYLAVPAGSAISGRRMVDSGLLHAGDWAEVTARSTAAVERVGCCTGRGVIRRTRIPHAATLRAHSPRLGCRRRPAPANHHRRLSANRWLS